MKTLFKKTFFILLIAYQIFPLSCKKDKDNEEMITFSGIVIDQITRKPVDNAYVYIGLIPFCEPHKLEGGNWAQSISGLDGSYKISMSKSKYEDIDLKYGCPVLYARKTGYIGSLIGYTRSLGSNGDILQMVHFGKLKLHIKNDTISNKIDTAGIYFDRFWPNCNCGANYSRICIGRKYDDTLFFDNLWSGIRYNFIIGPINVSHSYFRSYAGYFSGSFILKPDTITEYSVTF